MGNAFVRMVAGSSARRLVLVVVLSLLVAASADAALLIHQRNAAVQIIRPTPQSSLLPPGTPTAGSVPATCASAASAANPIVAENTCPGTIAWQADHPFGDQHAIEAFTVPASVNRGGTIDLYVNTTAPSYSFQLFRMGWYDGAGARLVYTSPTLTGHQQPAPAFDSATRTMSADTWRDPIQVTIPQTFVSGVYVVKLLSSQGYMRYDLFTVRDDASTAPLIFQSSIYTYQAYNSWGGYSLYHDFLDPGQSFDLRAYAVTMDRPYASNDGLGDFPSWEYPALRWLERQGYDMSYQTDADLNASGADLGQHKLVVVTGHSEYWSSAMRANITAARDAGVSLAFMGANNIYWRVRTASTPFGADRLIICYKEPANDPYASNPALATTFWAGENTVLGEAYFGLNYTPQDGVFTSAATPLLAGTGLQPGDHIPGIIGGELERLQAGGTPPGTVALLASPVTCAATSCEPEGTATADSTLYTAASGARVFDAGTFQWSWGLDDAPWPTVVTSTHHYANAEFQKFNTNLFAYLLHEPQPGATASPTPSA